MAKTQKAKIISKKHLDRLHREQRQTRTLIGVAIVVIAAVILLIGYGVLDQTVLQLRKPALTVNGESISMREFQVRVRAQRQALIDQYMQYYQFGLMLGMDPTTDQSLSQYLGQISSQLDNSSTIASQVILDARDAILIRQYAEANGIAAAPEEVQQAIHAAYGYYPEGSPTPTLTAAMLASSTLSSTQLALITPTMTLTPAPTRTQVPTVTPDLSATPTSVPSLTPTATAYTEEGFQSNFQLGLDYYSKLEMSEADYRTIYFEDALNRRHVTDLVTADVPHEQDMVWARHILVADEETAKIVRDQLLAGVDFATLAAQYSIDTSNKDTGGDLGWFSKGTMVAEFENAAWALKIGEISQPVQSQYGWHIIQVLGHEVRPLADSDYQNAVNTAFESWLQEQRDAADVVFADDWVNFVPDTPTLQQAFDASNATQTAVSERYQSEQQTLDAQFLAPTPTPVPQ
jgi:peptidyl-prolyl cis-trans isomerase D